MDRRVVIAASIVAVVSLVFAVHIYQVSATGSSFMSPVLSAGLSGDLEQATAEETGYKEHIIVSFEPTSQALSAQELNVRAQTIRSLTVRNLSVYGFEFEYEEVIADFGMAIGTAPAENVGRIAGAPQVRAVSRNPFISIEPLQQAGGYADFSNIKEFHEVDELPRAENIVVSVVDSGAPRKPWITKAVTARGDSPYIGFYHGAAVCKTVHEVAPSAKITSVKTLGDAGTARLSTIIEGLSMAVHTDPQADVINLSLGTDASGYNPMDTACDTLVREYGVKIVTAAGNTFQGPQTSPATAASTLAVGAIGTDGELTDYSASEYDVVAIGDVRVDIAGVSSARGTSFASPVVAAMTARWMAGQGGVDRREIDMIGSVTQAAKVFQETEEKLPVVKGSNLAETSASKKSSPTERAVIPLIITGFSVFIIFWSLED
jgi:hypothetical protein